MSETFYELLGVDADASQSAIREAYREKVKEYHPDVSDHPDATERFKRLKRAEEVLTDPDERAAYDRLGHETYVGDGDAGSDASGGATDATTVADVREAAARTAGWTHDGGGRSAGWRDRERRRRTARRRAADWFGDDGADDAGSTTRGRGGSSARRDSSGGADAGPSAAGDATGGPDSEPGDDATVGGGATVGGDATAGGDETAGDGATVGDVGDAWWEDLAGDAAGPRSKHWTGDLGGRAGVGGADGGRAAGSDATSDDGSGAQSGRGSRARARADARGERTGRGSPDPTRHAATDAWGHQVDRRYAHAVHEWPAESGRARVRWPDWTQDDVVTLVSTLFLYPILLALTVFPSFPLAVNLVAGAAVIAYVTVLLPRPAMALPIFGTWSVGAPAFLLWLGVPLTSGAALVALAGVWTPLLFAVAVASVLLS